MTWHGGPAGWEQAVLLLEAKPCRPREQEAAVAPIAWRGVGGGRRFGEEMGRLHGFVGAAGYGLGRALLMVLNIAHDGRWELTLKAPAVAVLSCRSYTGGTGCAAYETASHQMCFGHSATF